MTDVQAYPANPWRGRRIRQGLDRAARLLRAESPRTSLRKLAAALTEQGHINRRGLPYSASADVGQVGRARTQLERRPVRGWMALTVMSLHPTVRHSKLLRNRRTAYRNCTLV